MRIFQIFLLFILIVLITSCNSKEKDIEYDFTTKFEYSNGEETATYDEVIEFYTQLSETYQSVTIYQMGKTDSGKPLHLVTFNPNRSFESEFSKDQKQNILLINNGIHPGESDGIDATMMLIRDLAQQKI